MSKPCSQLNSKVIRDKAESHIIAAIEKKCFVVAFKCVWRVHDDEIERAWNWICERETNAILLCPNWARSAFSFRQSALQNLTAKSNRLKDHSRMKLEKATIRMRNLKSILHKSLHKGKNISCNIILAGVSNSERFCSESTQDSTRSCNLWLGVLPASREKSSHDLNQPCQVLKDHKNPCLMNFVEASYQHCLRLINTHDDRVFRNLPKTVKSTHCNLFFQSQFSVMTSGLPWKNCTLVCTEGKSTRKCRSHSSHSSSYVPWRPFCWILWGIRPLKIGLSNISSLCYHCWVSQKAILSLNLKSIATW